MTDPTPLLDLPALAEVLGLARVWAKDESRRPLGNFKSLGGGRAAAIALAEAQDADPVLICASDGNHGLSVAAAARADGARSRVYLPISVGSMRVERIRSLGAEIVRVAGTYDDAVRAAAQAAGSGEGILIADTGAIVDDPVVADVMDGYAAIADEIAEQLADDWPTHLFVQAGVGGLAAAVAGGMLGSSPHEMKVVVVEPAAAACVGAALSAGKPVQIGGALETCAEMLSCGLASAGAVARLLRCGARAIGVNEMLLADAPDLLVTSGGPVTTASGAAGLAGLVMVLEGHRSRKALEIDASSRILLIVSEGATE